MTLSELENWIADVPDFPKPGIVFKDLTPLLQDAGAFSALMDHLERECSGLNVTAVAAIESRGFIFGAALADRLKVGLVLLRKPGKLPRAVHSSRYQLEYGEDELQMHHDALGDSERVLLIDDVLATGGTAQAAQELISRTGSECVMSLFVLRIPPLKGEERLKGLVKALFPCTDS